MKKFLLLIVCLCAMTSVFTRDFYSEYVAEMQAENFENVATVLSEWEKDSPDNPEMLIGYFNYYLNRNLESTTVVGQMPDGRYGMYEQRTFDADDVAVGVSYLDKALEKNPARLDIHFGKCSSLLQAEKYNEASIAIVNLLKTSKEVNNMWLWTNNEAMVQNSLDGETELFYGMNDHCSTLFNYFDITHEFLKDIFIVSEQLYPNNVIGLNIAARYYGAVDDIEKATLLLKRAHSIDKNDYIILANLGYYAERENKYSEAKEYYELMLTIDDENAKQYGQQYLTALEEKM